MNPMSGFAAHYGHWDLVLFLIVLVSWAFYRYAAPSGWREWAGAGLVQAFLVALYAEMFGFPLTIYLLTGFLGLDIPHTPYAGHLWATLLGYGAIGAIVEMLLGYALLAAGIVLLIRGWTAVYAARCEERIAREGLYGVIRHPQYAGILLAVLGEVVHWPTLITLALFPAIVFVYVRLARKEERDMICRFGATYADYMRRVPMFLPGRGQWRRLFGAFG
ncbi:methyltransferase family protein (plasmid) [Cupriavidus basilensis]|uniref:methyltransferase family protein n=1 Tax=unclassified Cupriavidus TaxID=2640874 RepID=UPI0010F7D480|nr:MULTISPECIES: isoprenylcysteine carboxylmethyltransferase family protein [unclassified Cupriavidus]MWL92193.1 isoprenylcysteine carboxyl methyltransferase [Cupriavidus sp. SW-Y-13]